MLLASQNIDSDFFLHPLQISHYESIHTPMPFESAVISKSSFGIELQLSFLESSSLFDDQSINVPSNLQINRDV